MAKAEGVSEATVRRIWQRHRLKPHLMRTFNLSRDPHFVERVEDVVGLYLNPPEHAIMLSVDKKSQIQALDRTQPGLPLKKGRAATMTHHYTRYGTTTLFAALDTRDSCVLATCMQRHRHTEWLRFLRMIDRSLDASKRVHIIADTPRFHVHFTPAVHGSTWSNASFAT